MALVFWMNEGICQWLLGGRTIKMHLYKKFQFARRPRPSHHDAGVAISVLEIQWEITCAFSNFLFSWMRSTLRNYIFDNFRIHIYIWAKKRELCQCIIVIKKWWKLRIVLALGYRRASLEGKKYTHIFHLQYNTNRWKSTEKLRYLFEVFPSDSST